MQLATQRTSKAASNRGPQRGSRDGVGDRRTPKDARSATIAAIHITWAKLARGMKGDKDELRQARLDFMSTVLKREVTTSRGLSQAKLGKVLDAMRDLERAPMLPGGSPTVDRGPQTATQNGQPSSVAGQVVHLATSAQCVTINKLFAHLGWTLEFIQGFIFKRFKRNSPRMLTPPQANSLTMILLTIAASMDIKRRWKLETGSEVEKVSREMIRAEIPRLKLRLGIDQGSQGQEAGSRRQEAEDEEDYGDD